MAGMITVRQREVAPNTPTMTACKVLFWIGLGIPKTMQDVNDDMNAALDRWGVLPTSPVLEALQGRVASEPYCAIRMVTPALALEVRSSAGYAHPFLSPEGPRRLRRVRSKARHREQRHVSYQELATMLEKEIAAEVDTMSQVKAATAELLGAIRHERVTVWGQRDFELGKPNRGAVHERIPLEIFMHPAMSVTIFDQVQPDSDAPIEQWIHWKGPNFSAVKFKTSEILAIWPALNHGVKVTENVIDPLNEAGSRPQQAAGSRVCANVNLRSAPKVGGAGAIETSSRSWRAPQREAAERAILAIWPDGVTLGTMKSIRTRVNDWLREQGAEPVSYDSVSRAIKTLIPRP